MKFKIRKKKNVVIHKDIILFNDSIQPTLLRLMNMQLETLVCFLINASSKSAHFSFISTSQIVFLFNKHFFVDRKNAAAVYVIAIASLFTLLRFDAY